MLRSRLNSCRLGICEGRFGRDVARTVSNDLKGASARRDAKGGIQPGSRWKGSLAGDGV